MRGPLVYDWIHSGNGDDDGDEYQNSRFVETVNIIVYHGMM